MTDFAAIPDAARELSIADLPVGAVATLAWTVRREELDAFAALSGDRNPMHMDASYAGAHGFPDRVSHGMLLGAKVSGFIGMVMPGRRCLLLEQTLAFPAPVLPGDEVVIAGEVVEADADQSVIRIRIRATKRGEKRPVARGHVLCKVLS